MEERKPAAAARAAAEELKIAAFFYRNLALIAAADFGRLDHFQSIDSIPLFFFFLLRPYPASTPPPENRRLCVAMTPSKQPAKRAVPSKAEKSADLVMGVSASF